MKTPLILKSYFSPFKPPKIKFYVGKVAIGVPYFYPRKWVKATPKLAHEATIKYLEETESFNKRNPDYKRRVRDYDEVYQEKLRCRFATSKKIGVDFCDVGWKTKWRRDDYRFEWSSRLSFVFFKWQIALIFIAPHEHHYWESFLAWHYETDKNLSWQERVKNCREKYPNTWTTHSAEGEETVDYYTKILKNKYLN